MRKWVDKKSEEEGIPWSKLPTFTEDEIKLIKGACLTDKILFFFFFIGCLRPLGPSCHTSSFPSPSICCSCLPVT